MRKINLRKRPSRTKHNSGQAMAKVADTFLAVIPERFTGDRLVMENRYRAIFTGGIINPMVRTARSRTTVYYLCLTVLFVTVLFQTLLGILGDDRLPNLDRDAYGGSVKHIPARVEANYGNTRVKKDVQLNLQPVKADPKMIASEMDALKMRLPRLICGENPGLNGVTSPLELLSKDTETGISILWETSDPLRIDQKGNINFLTGEEGSEVVLTAYFRKGDLSDSVDIKVVLGDAEKTLDLDRVLSDNVEALVASINASSDEPTIELPGKTNTGVELKWGKQRNLKILMVLPFLLLAIYYVYRQRYHYIDIQIETRRASIRADFPDFLGKLLLLLHAGMVVTGAISRIADDYRSLKRPNEEHAFYEELCEIETKARASNTALTAEFFDFSKRCGLREIQRFSAILSDNIDKGSVLSEKIAQEHDTLWSLRKKTAQEKGKLAETKLTFPMVLQLLVIILITVAPAAVQMY